MGTLDRSHRSGGVKRDIVDGAIGDSTSKRSGTMPAGRRYFACTFTSTGPPDDSSDTYLDPPHGSGATSSLPQPLDLQLGRAPLPSCRHAQLPRVDGVIGVPVSRRTICAEIGTPCSSTAPNCLVWADRGGR